MSTRRYGWLASYPRSGNTWLRLALEALLTGLPLDPRKRRLHAAVAGAVEFEQVFGVAPGELTHEEIEESLPAFHRALLETFAETPVLRKVHDRFRRTSRGEAIFPADLSVGAVYIVRDPRDVAVSLAAFRARTLDETIAFLADPASAMSVHAEGMKQQFEQPLGSWSEHVSSWLDASNMPVHLVRYEDMLAEPCAHLTGIATFLGLPAGRVADAVAATRFETLRELEERSGFHERPATAKRFFRSGRAGAWTSVLNAAQCARIENDHGPAMARLGYLARR